VVGLRPVAGDLYERLKRLRSARAGADPAPVESSGGHTSRAARSDAGSRSAASDRSAGTGTHAGPGLSGTPFPGWDGQGELVFQRTIEVPVSGPATPMFDSRLLGKRVSFADLCFMDTETTGLSGGAGTTVFLVGSGHFEDGILRVVQTFLADFSGETDFLDVVYGQLWTPSLWVSYNGKAFDSRLLQTRFLLNGRDAPLPDQLDLLYWARRLWRRTIGACSLSDVEREILRFEREGDIPGIEIPDRYFAYLRTGDPAPLDAVFAHHARDIVSLFELFLRLERVLESVAISAWDAVESVDRVSLGRHLVLSDGAGGEGLLREVVEHPLAGETLADRERAAALLCRSLRRRGHVHAASDVWRLLWGDGSLASGIEYAKYLEHQRKSPAAAAEIVTLLAGMTDNDRIREDLAHRLARLRRKIEG